MTFLFRGSRPQGRSAAEWIVRLNSTDRSEREEREFRAWLGAAPSNRAEFERLTEIWDIVPGCRASLPAPASDGDAPDRFSRRRAIAAIAGAAAVGAGGFLVAQPAMAITVHETGIGEQRQLHLADGSELLLDAVTRVRFRNNWLGRTLWVDRGRISLEIKRSDVPFTIDAGAGSLTARSGRFDLSRVQDDRAAFTALRGGASVKVEGAAHDLLPGERLRRISHNELTIDKPDPALAEAWKSGRAVFENEPLAEVAAEANRYSPVRLVVTDDQAARMRVSGIYRMGDNLAFAQSLSSMLGLEMRRGQGTVELGRPPEHDRLS